MKFYGRDRGSTIMGTTGTVLVDRDGYEVYDLKGKKTDEVQGRRNVSADLIGARFDDRRALRQLHRRHSQREKLNAPIAVGNVAVTMLQLSNIAWEVIRELQLNHARWPNPKDPEAMKIGDREYEKGWEPHV